VYDIETGRPALLDDLVLIELEHETADQLVALLNRSGRPRQKRLSSWPVPATRSAPGRPPR
jgi:hypothetical protein